MSHLPWGPQGRYTHPGPAFWRWEEVLSGQPTCIPGGAHAPGQRAVAAGGSTAGCAAARAQATRQHPDSKTPSGTVQPSGCRGVYVPHTRRPCLPQTPACLLYTAGRPRAAGSRWGSDGACPAAAASMMLLLRRCSCGVRAHSAISACNASSSSSSGVFCRVQQRRQGGGWGGGASGMLQRAAATQRMHEVHGAVLTNELTSPARLPSQAAK